MKIEFAMTRGRAICPPPTDDRRHDGGCFGNLRHANSENPGEALWLRVLPTCGFDGLDGSVTRVAAVAGHLIPFPNPETRGQSVTVMGSW